MSWVKRISPIRAGDTVAYSKTWLQSTGQLTGEIPFARGRVMSLIPLGSLVLAEIEWNTPNLPERVNVKNLSHVNEGQVMDGNS
jgi:hypothetical protein